MDELVEQYLRGYSAREDEVRRATRARSEEADVAAVPPDVGAALEFFARLTSARHVAEVGTGGGYSGLWLLAGMDPRGSLTTIAADREHQALAQRAFADARVADRVRSMLGPALSVLPRLADANYDLVYLDAATTEDPDCLLHAKRLLRGGGLLLAAVHAVTDSINSITTMGDAGVGAFAEAVSEDPQLLPLLLPLGEGLLAAVRLRPSS